jgi:hypothetical protein
MHIFVNVCPNQENDTFRSNQSKFPLRIAAYQGVGSSPNPWLPLIGSQGAYPTTPNLSDDPSLLLEEKVPSGSEADVV